VVTCSGAFKDGSLRVVRNGVGINEQASVDLPGIKGLWSLKPSSNDNFDKYIILSFVSETRVLSMSGEELEETEIPGFQADEQTTYSGNIINNQFLQVS
jgi:DNA damage-binding protein 1